MEDIPDLLDHFVKIYSQRYKISQVQYSSDLLQKIKEYHWPGNIRELQHAVERALLMCENGMVTAEDLLVKRSATEKK